LSILSFFMNSILILLKWKSISVEYWGDSWSKIRRLAVNIIFLWLIYSDDGWNRRISRKYYLKPEPPWGLH
jgi:hypothetical protein